MDQDKIDALHAAIDNRLNHHTVADTETRFLRALKDVFPPSTAMLEAEAEKNEAEAEKNEAKAEAAMLEAEAEKNEAKARRTKKED